MFAAHCKGDALQVRRGLDCPSTLPADDVSDGVRSLARAATLVPSGRASTSQVLEDRIAAL